MLPALIAGLPPISGIGLGGAAVVVPDRPRARVGDADLVMVRTLRQAA